MDRNLWAFLAIASSGNLSIAAETLGLTQPSLTKRLANLEEEMGALLFERHRRGVRLTEAGQQFLIYARRIKLQYSQAHEQVAAVQSAGMGRLRVGAGPLFHLRYAARVFNRIKADFPHLVLDFYADTNVRTVPMLLEERLDVVLGPFPVIADDSIGFKPVTTTEHGVVLRHDDPAAAGIEVDPYDLEGHAWVLYTENPESQDDVTRYYHLNNLPSPRMEAKSSSFAFCLQLVATGGFVMTAPLQLGPMVARDGLVILPAKRGLPQFEVGILYRKSAQDYAVIQRFLDAFDNLPDLRDLDSYKPAATPTLRAR